MAPVGFRPLNRAVATYGCCHCSEIANQQSPCVRSSRNSPWAFLRTAVGSHTVLTSLDVLNYMYNGFPVLKARYRYHRRAYSLAALDGGATAKNCSICLRIT